MDRMNDKAKGRQGAVKKLLGGTAPVAPAIEAAAERAAIERDPASTEGVAPAPTAPVLPVEGLPDDRTAVLPEPTLTAEPDRPAPIVTASPPLAAEPSAMDVVQADAAADRIDAGVATDADREGPRLAAAGQPTLAIDGNGAVANAMRNTLRDGVLDNFVGSTRASLNDRYRHDFDRQPGADLVVLDLDDLLLNLQLLADHDPAAMEAIRQRFFGSTIIGTGETTGPTVTVIEVTGPERGRRRAGMVFGPKPHRFLASDLRADELDAFRNDPQLAVGVTQLGIDEAAIAFPGVDF